jgi:hypothetical protein
MPVKTKPVLKDTELTEHKVDPKFKRFYLVRNVDKTGMSGTGYVAEGVQFSDGTCILKWISTTSAIGIYHSTVEMLHIHTHGGKDATKIEFVD